MRKPELNTQYAEITEMDKPYIEYLTELCNYFTSERIQEDRQTGRNFLVYSPRELLVDLKFLKKHYPNIAKGIDLGCGSGYVMAALENEGIQMYGIEKDEEILTEAEKRLLGLGIMPRMVLGNYFSQLEEVVFDDGTKLEGIDYFFCNTYGAAHAFDIFHNIMGNPSIKIGALYRQSSYARAFTKKMRAQFERSGYESMPVSKQIHSGSFFRKKEESQVDPSEIDQILRASQGYKRVL